jgi:hypothetical protein
VSNEPPGRVVGTDPMSQEDHSRLPTEKIARLLMECAKQDPALVGRPRPVAAARQAALRQDTAMAYSRSNLPAGAMGIHLQLEELASVVVESAEQAEEALRLARATARSARRGMVVFAGIGALGILVGVAGTTGHGQRGTTDIAQIEVAAGEDGPNDDAAKVETVGPGGAAPARQGGMVQGAATGTAGTEVRAAPAAPTEPAAAIPSPPVYRGPVGEAAPWQAYQPPARRLEANGVRRTAAARSATPARRHLTMLFPPSDR